MLIQNKSYTDSKTCFPREVKQEGKTVVTMIIKRDEV
jgi:hypothetical protein